MKPITITREGGKDLINLEERSIRELVRIYNPQNPSKFADDLCKKKCYATSHKRMVKVIESEMLKGVLANDVSSHS